MLFRTVTIQTDFDILTLRPHIEGWDKFSQYVNKHK